MFFKLSTLSSFFLISSLLCAAESQNITFSAADKIIKTIPVSKLSEFASVRSIKVWEPHENKDITYKGYSLTDLLKKIYGNNWNRYSLVYLVCADGYKAAVPSARVEAEKSYLTYERVGQAFTLNNRFQNEKNVRLDPLYLVWDNINKPELRAEEGSNWPYQVVGIELSDFSTKFPHMSLPKESPEAAKLGFVHFQKYCITCHKINGDGGDKGPELNSPLSVTERPSARKYLTNWISDPRKIRPNSIMGPFNRSLPNRDEVISQIVSYLEEMAKHKFDPDKDKSTK